MPEGVILYDRAYFDSPEWLNQKNAQDGFGRGAAWLDLLALANQKATTMEIRGLRIPIERGQCGRSKLALAQRWGYSQGKAAMLLAHWEKSGRLKVESGNDTTVITILNFDAWQTSLAATVCEQTASSFANKPGADCEQTATDREKDKDIRVPRGVGRGVGDPAAGSETILLPTDEEVRTFCEAWPGDLSRGIPTGIPEVWWSGWMANRLQDEKKWPRDWQRALVLAFRADFLNRHPKALAGLTPASGKSNGTTATGSTGDGRSPAQRRFELDRALREVRERLNQAHELEVPTDPEDIALEKRLEKSLTELNA